nr:alpha/beta fold hydrolase [Cohnella sp. CFH 77786]
MTVPAGDGPYPVAILVHGSGPHDRDSTIGGTKVFKDLAAGLASQGIAVLRYEKVTEEHTFKVAMQPKFTLANETVDDVFRAAKLLKTRIEIDPARIYVIGHSQGGFAVPMMFGRDAAGDLAGAVLLSAPSQSFAEVMVEQQHNVLERMEELGLPAEAIQAQKQTASMVETASKMLNDRTYSTDNLPARFPFQPAYWWYEQRDYVPAAVAAIQTKPMLILQGENDWQVSMKQFQVWKDALKNRTGVEFASYPKVNHLLTEYDGMSVGMEYGTPAHVSPAIVRDIGKWILKRK